MELHKGDKYKDVDGTEFQVFGALDDTYTYYLIANLRQNIVIRMQPKNAAALFQVAVTAGIPQLIQLFLEYQL